MKNGELACQGTPVEAFTTQNIRSVFSIDVEVAVSVHTNKPYIYAMTKNEITKNNVKTHIICGGGSGSEIISNLFHSGFDVSAGVLSIGDLDWKVSKDFELKVAEDTPFTRISDDAYTINKKLAVEADYIIVTDFYIGKANIRNLEVLLEADLDGKTVLILGDESIAQRDITDGMALSLYNKIKSRKSSITVSKEEMYSILNKAGAANE
jgi:iron complex transport system ATP-binding protein